MTEENNNTHMLITEARLKEILTATVYETMFNLGIRVDSPDEIQKLRRDLQFIRDFRKASDNIKSKGVIVVFSTLATGALAAMFLGIRDLFKTHGGG